MNNLSQLIKTADLDNKDEDALSELARELIRRGYPKKSVAFDAGSFVKAFNAITPERQIKITEDNVILGKDNERSRKLKFKYTDLRKNEIDCFVDEDSYNESLDLNEMKTYNDIANSYCATFGFEIKIDEDGRILYLDVFSLLIENECISAFNSNFSFHIECIQNDFDMFVDFVQYQMNCENSLRGHTFHLNEETKHIERIEKYVKLQSEVSR